MKKGLRHVRACAVIAFLFIYAGALWGIEAHVTARGFSSLFRTGTKLLSSSSLATNHSYLRQLYIITLHVCQELHRI
jgi:hypothetical protein